MSGDRDPADALLDSDDPLADDATTDGGAALTGLFAPERVAVVGATDREGSVGRAVTENLIAEFDGEVVPVNPSRDEVLGLSCVGSVADADADMAVVAVPPGAVIDVVRECGESGVDNVVVLTAGFGETGAEGADREQQLRSVAEEYDLNLVGPNSLGVMSSPRGLNATFGPDAPPAGAVSFMSQSGAFVTAVVDWAKEQGVGFKDVVSLGNKAVLDETDFVRAWGDDPDTDVVVGYLESIDDGRAFVDAARETTDDTPVTVVKSGRTDAGAQAASSHTGAIAGSDRAYEAGLDAAGVLRAESVQELFDSARALAGGDVPESDGVAVVTNAGGPGVMATDAVGDAERLRLASFDDGTVERLGEALPDEANVYNPVDVIGDASVDRFREALDIALRDPDVGTVVVITAPTATLDFGELGEMIADAADEHGVPMAACLMGGGRLADARDVLRERGVPSYFDPARAVGGLESLAEYREVRGRSYPAPEPIDADRDRVREILSSVEERSDNRLGVEAMEIFDAYGIPTPEGAVVDDPAEAEQIAEGIGEEVVMKIVSPDILHKSDIGGVKVGVPVAEVADAYEDLVSRARNYQPDATILGVQVQELIDLDDGVETIVGSHTDPQFGPLVMFGLGGVFVEIMEDTTFRLAPVGCDEAAEMTEEIDAAPLLRGARGREAVDIDSVVDAVRRVSQLVADFPSIVELDVNPLVATPDGVRAVDLRLTVDPEELESQS
ncbi:acetate--CoA ligase family protein [Halobaculum magnesiiphilum]|uniref:acetate--CoA ligase (ADP-forming) n=1 Tax=Halobaculum magnesiiphilum TaxID=1017351 RepID=A0A8T8WJG2_9EURY|nr:acetate--CoA ligase [Halobaculum magnesiiphilum]QZP39793.1 acetate--CoA ligase family protein [Halobaculum magnesiiphilum]